MSLHRDDWLREAQKLSVGQKKRVRHGFEASAAMDVYNNADSWSAYCHRCHESGRVVKVHQSILRRVEEPNRVTPVPATVIRFNDATQYEQQRMWRLLCEKGCPPGVIPEELLWYERSVNRLMLIQNDQCLGRALDKWRSPKWLPYGAWHGKPMVWQTRTGAGVTVLVEDALSGYKVAKAIECFAPASSVRVIATLGTRITDAFLPYIVKDTVLCMYDGDKAGLDGFEAMRKRLRVWGAPVLDLRPPLGDPKNNDLAVLAERMQRWL
jgi:hypothetical protein